MHIVWTKRGKEGERNKGAPCGIRTHNQQLRRLVLSKKALLKTELLVIYLRTYLIFHV